MIFTTGRGYLATFLCMALLGCIADAKSFSWANPSGCSLDLSPWSVIKDLSANNSLSHLIYFNDDPIRVKIFRGLSLRIVDLNCDHLKYGVHKWKRLFPRDTPIINVAINCPLQYLQKVRRRSDHVLSNPILNLIIANVNNTTEARREVMSWTMVDTLLFIQSCNEWLQETFDYGSHSFNSSQLDFHNSTVADIWFICSPSSVNNSLLVEALMVGRDVTVGRISGLISDRFKGFGGRSLLIGSMKATGFLYVHHFDTGVTHSGYVVELSNVFAEKLNFSYNIIAKTDSKYGSRYKNGSWYGLVGDLVNMDVDLIVADISIVEYRREVLDYTVPHWETSLAVTFRIYYEDWFYVFRPFTGQVWLLAGITAVSTGILLWYLKTVFSHKERSLESLSNSMWYAFSTFLYQGSGDRTKSVSSRIVAASLWFGVIALVAPYSGILVASFATRRISLPFSTLDELAEDKEYTLMTIEGNTAYSLFKKTPTGVISKLWKKMSSDPQSFAPSLEIVTSRLFGDSGDKKWAYVGTKTSSAHRWAEIGSCDWAFLPDTIPASGFAAALPARSPFTKYFSQIITQLAETGMLQRWTRKHFPAETCGLDRTRNPDWRGSNPIKISDIIGLVIILSVGIVLALFALFTEIISENVAALRKVFLYKRRRGAEGAREIRGKIYKVLY